MIRAYNRCKLISESSVTWPPRKLNVPPGLISIAMLEGIYLIWAVMVWSWHWIKGKLQWHLPKNCQTCIPSSDQVPYCREILSVLCGYSWGRSIEWYARQREASIILSSEVRIQIIKSFLITSLAWTWFFRLIFLLCNYLRAFACSILFSRSLSFISSYLAFSY